MKTNRLGTKNQYQTRQFASTGKLIVCMLVFVVVLAGCSSDKSTKVILVRVRPAQVEAQSPRNQFDPAALRATPTATPKPRPTAKPAATHQESDPLPTATIPLPPPPTAAPLDPITVPIGRPERVVIPSIDVDAQVQTVESQANQIGNQWFNHWQTAAYAAGFHASSALLGQAGNTVISGHNNIDGSVFRNLYQVEPGQVIQLYANGYRYDYIVEDQFILREQSAPIEQRVQNASWIQTTIDERLTLVSCWPPTGNEFRVIVVAKPLSRMAGTGVPGPN